MFFTANHQVNRYRKDVEINLEKGEIIPMKKPEYTVIDANI
ncbi:hypothetical protein PD280_07880 [Virgibacillus salarius]|nr:hypothetical protein [Virgibacillus salarius]WBX81600.1 hypothetical protein PD280_07880 [Virgibacillus salarius]